MTRLIENADGNLTLLPAAPPEIPAGQRAPIPLLLPDGKFIQLEYSMAEAMHHDLGQALARGMRRR